MGILDLEGFIGIFKRVSEDNVTGVVIVIHLQTDFTIS